MQKIPDNLETDVIVIGAGIGGLTTAAVLARSGKRVCVLEMDARPGGYLAGFQRKEFRFDTAIHWLNQCGEGGLVHRIFEWLGNDFPRVADQKMIRRYKGESFDYILTNNPDELRDTWIREYPHEKKGIERFFADARKLGKAFKKMGTQFRSAETMGPAGRMAYGLKMLQFGIPFMRFLRYSGNEGIRKGLNRYFKDPALHNVFCSEPDLLSCLVPVGWAYYVDYQLPPRGGSQVFPEWLVHLLQELDGQIFYRCRAERICIESGQSRGVEFLHRGKKYRYSSRYVIAACDVETLYEKMLPQGTIPDAFLKKLRSASLYASSVTVSLGLNCCPSLLGFGEELLFISKDNMARKSHSEGPPDQVGISVLAPSLRDPSLAPEGMGTLTMYAPADFGYADFWQTEEGAEGERKRSGAYEAFKQQYAGILIARVEAALGIQLTPHIVYCDIATPITHWRYTGNKNGSIMGARPGWENIRAGIAHHKTRIANLYLSGHWAELGGGVPIAVKSGFNAALLVLKKEKHPAYTALCRYADGKMTLDQAQQVPGLKSYLNTFRPGLTPALRKTQRSGNIGA